MTRLFRSFPVLIFLCAAPVRGATAVDVLVDDETKPRTGSSLTVPPGTDTLRIEVHP